MVYVGLDLGLKAVNIHTAFTPAQPLQLPLPAATDERRLYSLIFPPIFPQ